MHIGAVILLLAALAVLARTAHRARSAFRASRIPGGRSPRAAAGASRTLHLDSPRSRPPSVRRSGTGFLAHRRAMAAERLKHQHGILRDEARHRHGLIRDWARHWMRLQARQAEWDRQAPVREAPPAGKPQAGTPGTPRPAAGAQKKPTVITPDGKPATATPPPAATPGPAPGTPPSPPPQPPQPEGTPVSNPGPVEAAVDGMQRVHATAASGNIRRKQWAIKVCGEIYGRSAALALMLASTLGERGYGPEISEPMARAASLAAAAAMACAEADTAITSLARMTVGDLADSPRQAPVREELSETGAR